MRRAVGSIDNSAPDRASRDIAAGVLNEAQMALWDAMPGRDRRHSLDVLRRFDLTVPGASGEERAAALLHDVGKTAADLGWFMRVLATVVGPRTARFRTYHDHEELGARLIAGCSDTRTVELVRGSTSDGTADALRRADEI